MSEAAHETVDLSPEQLKPGELRRRRLRRFLNRSEVVKITDARRGAAEYRAHRKRIYTVLQVSRIPLLLLSLLTFLVWETMTLSMIILLVSVPLPWIAVVIANESNQKVDKRERNVYKPGLVRQQQRFAAAGGLEARARSALPYNPDTVYDSSEI